MYNIILIGAGYWGKNFLRLLHDMKSMYNFIGVVEINNTIQKNINAKYPTLPVYKDYTKTFHLADIYLIATPVSTHYTIAKTCLQNNKHIIVEKPLTDNSKKTEDLIQIADKNNCRIFVNFTPIYTGPFNFICNRYQNKLDSIFFINSNRCNLGIIRDDCNVVEDLTCHDIAMLLYFLNEEPDYSSIKCSSKKCYSKNCDMITIQMFFPKNNILCNLYTSWVDNEKKREFSIISKNEKLIYDDTKCQKSIKINFSNISIESQKINYNFKDESIPLQTYKEPIRNQLTHYFDCLKNNKPCKTNAKFSLKVNNVIDYINKLIH